MARVTTAAAAVAAAALMMVLSSSSALAQDSPPNEALSLHLPGFSPQSGLRAGDLFKVDLAVNETREPASEVFFTARNPGNRSEFSICMRIKAHYQRPEMILLSAYTENKTSLVIGLDERNEQLYLKTPIVEDGNELVRDNFPWLPRLDTWEHICIVKKPVAGDNEYNHVAFFVNGEQLGNSSAVAAPVDDLTLLVLGQSHPASTLTAFSGEVAQFGMWSRGLTETEVAALATCDPNMDNLLQSGLEKLAFKEGNWKFLVERNNETTIEPLAVPRERYLGLEELCFVRSSEEAENDGYTLLPLYREKSFEYHSEMCDVLGGHMAHWSAFETEEAASSLFISAKIPRVLPSALLTPEGEDPSYTTPLNMQSCFTDNALVIWIDGPRRTEPGEDDEQELPEHCPTYVFSNGTVVEKCDNDPVACSLCVIKNAGYLTLRGLCDSARLNGHRGKPLSEASEEFDSEFFPRADKTTGEIEFRGKYGSRIRRNESLTEVSSEEPREWILESLVSPYRSETQAVVRKISANSFPIGRHIWYIGSEVCNADAAAAVESPGAAPRRPISLSLTSCSSDQFTCNSGHCSPVSYRCDKWTDCGDNEDESDCTLLELHDDYKREEAPRKRTKNVPWEVFLEVDIVAFPEINAIDERFSSVFELKMRWHDPRLDFRNIKKGDITNPLSSSDLIEVWVPRLGLLNGLSEFQTIVTDDNANEYRGYALRQGTAEANGIDSDIEDEIFPGEENSIVLRKQFFQEFTCSFDLVWYPFDRQKCFLMFTVQGQTNKSLVLEIDDEEVDYYGKEYLVEYIVEDRRLYIEASNRTFSTAIVEVSFQRRVVYHLFNIFLQSVLLVLTGYMSMFFHVNNFSDRVMVALTVMLVMASLQSAVQDTLPKTSYFKFIDWWLLVALNTQIFIMAFHTYLGTAVGREYRRYRDSFSLNDNNAAAAATGLSASLDSRATKQSINNLDAQEEPLSPEEYKYPKSTRLNKMVNILFIGLFLLFNIVYWVVALCIYFT